MNQGKRYRLPRMKRGSSLIRIAESNWSGGRTAVKAFWVDKGRRPPSAKIMRAQRPLVLSVPKELRKSHFRLRRFKLKAWTLVKPSAT